MIDERSDSDITATAKLEGRVVRVEMAGGKGCNSRRWGRRQHHLLCCCAYGGVIGRDSLIGDVVTSRCGVVETLAASLVTGELGVEMSAEIARCGEVG